MKLVRIFVLALSLLLTSCANQSDSNSDFSNSDLMFAAMMIPHHEQALEMSTLALEKSKNSQVRALAQEIYDAQTPEIKEMKSWGDVKANSHEGHVMNGMLTETEMQQLADASESTFDELFLKGMIKHHEGAIEMAEMVVDSRNAKAAALGKAIIDGQAKEIKRMKEMLQS